MFTVDKEDGSHVITSLDSLGHFSDVELILDEDQIYIRQWDEHWQEYSVIILSHQQLADIRTAIRGL